MENHTFLSQNSTNYAFEIKPKWGFLPPGQTTCRFHKHSALKGKLTPFCPLDLFSESKDRIRSAILDLMSMNENNWKVFVDSEPVPFNRHRDVVNLMFFNDADANIHLATVLSDILHVDGILPQLAVLQRKLDSPGISKIQALTKSFGFELEDLIIDVSSVDWALVLQKFHSGSTDCPKSMDELYQKLFEYIISMTLKDCSIFITIVFEKGLSLLI